MFLQLATERLGHEVTRTAVKKLNIQTCYLMETMKKLINSASNSAKILSKIDSIFLRFEDKLLDDSEIKEIAHLYTKSVVSKVTNEILDQRYADSKKRYLKVDLNISSTTTIPIVDLVDYEYKQLWEQMLEDSKEILEEISDFTFDFDMKIGTLNWWFFL